MTPVWKKIAPPSAYLDEPTANIWSRSKWKHTKTFWKYGKYLQIFGLYFDRSPSNWQKRHWAITDHYNRLLYTYRCVFCYIMCIWVCMAGYCCYLCAIIKATEPFLAAKEDEADEKENSWKSFDSSDFNNEAVFTPNDWVTGWCGDRMSLQTDME